MNLDSMANNSETPQWFAVQTRHHHEKRVAERLERVRMETFLPTHCAVHRWSNGVRATVELPLFPCYLFVRFNRTQRVQLLQDAGVIGLAASNRSPTPIADNEIFQLRSVADSLKAEPHPYLAIGEKVRVIAGPFSGIQGILLRQKHGLRVVVSIEIIMRSLTVEVSELDIEPVRNARASWVMA